MTAHDPGAFHKRGHAAGIIIRPGSITRAVHHVASHIVEVAADDKNPVIRCISSFESSHYVSQQRGGINSPPVLLQGGGVDEGGKATPGKFREFIEFGKNIIPRGANASFGIVLRT